MSYVIQHFDSPSTETIMSILDALREREDAYPGFENWSEQSLAGIPQNIQAFAASDFQGAVGLLAFCPGVFDPWGAPTDFLGANPILPDSEAAGEIHCALLTEAKAWATKTTVSGLEIFLPMGPDNMRCNEALDNFYAKLGFDRFYYTMTRDITSLDSPKTESIPMKVSPASTIAIDALYENFAATLAHGEIEFMSNMSEKERRNYFDSLAEETVGHDGSLVLLGDVGVLGFTLIAAMSDTSAHLAWIGILPAHRSNGLGQGLLRKSMTVCREKGVSRLSLYTDATVDAQSLYRNLGFEPAGTLAYRWH